MITIKNSAGEIIKTIEPDLNKTLLEQIQESGLEINYACGMGMCAACKCEIELGENNLIKNYKKDPEFRLLQNEILACIGGIKDLETDIILKTTY